MPEENPKALQVNLQVFSRIGRDQREADTVASGLKNCCFKSGVRRNKVKVHFQKFQVPRFGNCFSVMALCVVHFDLF